jgi:hypothetical protein
VSRTSSSGSVHRVGGTAVEAQVRALTYAAGPPHQRSAHAVSTPSFIHLQGGVPFSIPTSSLRTNFDCARTSFSFERRHLAGRRTHPGRFVERFGGHARRRTMPHSASRASAIGRSMTGQRSPSCLRTGVKQPATRSNCERLTPSSTGTRFDSGSRSLPHATEESARPIRTGTPHRWRFKLPHRCLPVDAFCHVSLQLSALTFDAVSTRNDGRPARATAPGCSRCLAVLSIV